MPKKSPIDSYAKKDLCLHLAAVEKSLFDLRFRLMHYFAGREEIRERFAGIESHFKSYASDCKKEVERRLKSKMPNNVPEPGIASGHVVAHL